MKPFIKTILLIVFAATITIRGFADNKDDITLIVTSDGPTKDAAIKNALRTAIEQAYGVFVSSNTDILNDEIVKDEIATIHQATSKIQRSVSIQQSRNYNGHHRSYNKQGETRVLCKEQRI